MHQVPRAGFTLVELLVSLAVLGMLMVLVVQVLGSAQRSWKQVSSKVSQFREARQAFNRIVFSLGQATLNNYSVQIYQGTADPLMPPSKDLRTPPLGYARYSDLQFICGPSAGGGGAALTGLPAAESPGHAMFFQAPLGTSSSYRLPNGLNGCGFFVYYSNDETYRPDFLNTRKQATTARYRLWEFRTPVENNVIYNYSPGSSVPRQLQSSWYVTPLTKSRPVADNIILLVISPRLAGQDAVGTTSVAGGVTSIAPNYYYNSVPATPLTLPQKAYEHQLPPLVDVTMVAIDSATAERLSAVEDPSKPPLAEALAKSKFSAADQYVGDIRALEKALIVARINYRVFSTSVVIRSSKWGAGT